MKNYMKRFYRDETGAELIEVALAIAIVAILAAAIFGIIRILLVKIEQAGDMIGDIDPGILNGSGSGTGTGAGAGTGTGTGTGIGGTGTGTGAAGAGIGGVTE